MGLGHRQLAGGALVGAVLARVVDGAFDSLEPFAQLNAAAGECDAGHHCEERADRHQPHFAGLGGMTMTLVGCWTGWSAGRSMVLTSVAGGPPLAVGAVSPRSSGSLAFSSAICLALRALSA